MRYALALSFLLLLCLETAAFDSPSPAATDSPADTPSPPRYIAEIVREFPHDRRAFTQGLLIEGDFLYESTGLYGRSSLRKVELSSGRVYAQQNLAPHFFGEGLAALDGRLYQLTWRSRKCLVYDLATLAPIMEMEFPMEGWGLTGDGLHLFASNGSSRVHVLDPRNLAVLKSIQVHDRGRPVDRLNELEYIRGVLFANIWQSSQVAQIDPESGRVVGWIDLSGLRRKMFRLGREDIANGIAYDRQTDRLLVTGKRWPKIFEIRLVPVR